MFVNETIPEELKIDGITEQIAEFEETDVKMRKALQERINEGASLQNSLTTFRAQLKKALSDIGELRAKEASGEKVNAKKVLATRDDIAFNRREVDELEATLEAHKTKIKAAETEAAQAAQDLAEARLRRLSVSHHTRILSLLKSVEQIYLLTKEIQDLERESNKLAGPKNTLLTGQSLNEMLRCFGLAHSSAEGAIINSLLEHPTNVGKGVERIIARSKACATDRGNYQRAVDLATQRNPLPSRPTIELISDENESSELDPDSKAA